MTQNNDFLFVEKYRPQKIEQCALPEQTKQTFQQFVDNGQVPNLLLTGSPGIGKTTIAKALCAQLDCEYLMINGSEQRNIDTLRTTIKQFASTVSLNDNIKVVILDEADYLNPQSTQPALRSFMEEFSDNCRFIMTCNFQNKIIDPLQSRCTAIDFSINRNEKQQVAKQFYSVVKHILDSEQIDYDNKVVQQLIKKYFPDFRKVLNEVQRYSVSGKIDSGVLTTVDEQQFEQLINALKDKNFKQVRSWVVENVDQDIQVVVRWIYNNMKQHVQQESIPDTVLILNEYMYKHAFVADPEINIVAMLTELMGTVVWR